MATLLRPDSRAARLTQAQIPADEFAEMRRQNLARWPTGVGALDVDESVAFHRSLPRHKQLGWVMRQAAAEGRCLTQPRGGFATFEMQLELMRCLEQEGLADIVPTTTDSYTRNEQWALAAKGREESERAGRSMLNGYPMVNYGVTTTRKLIEAIDRPAIVLSGTAMPRLTSEIGLASGYSGYLGSGIAYTTSYTKQTSIAEGIRNYQYLDRLAALYLEKGVELHRRQPGFLTGTNIPPSIAIIVAILDALLAAAQGVRNYGLELAQTLHLIQDAAAVQMCGELCQEYLKRQGFADVFTPVTSLHWMGAWPHDEAQCAAIVAYGGTLAAVARAVNVTTKSTHEAIGIPTPKVNAEGLRITRMAIYMARNLRLDDLPEYQRECELIRREVRAVMDRVLEMGEGDAAVGTLRGFESGVLDIPWSPNREVKSRVMPARDVDGYLRILDPGAMPFPADVLAYHEERLRRRAEKEGVPYDHGLAVSSVYELSEPLERLMPFGFKT
jgi:methylaspartate mutase epsilon subunit